MNRKYNIYINYLLGIIFIGITLLLIKLLLFSNNHFNIEISAHRGSCTKAPENSISSIIQAIMEDADYVEIDAMTTKDNQVILFHDLNLYKINKSMLTIKSMTLEQIKKIDNGSYFSPKFKGEKIPTLEEALQVTKGNIKVNIDLKVISQDDALPIEVAVLIKKYDMEDEVIVSSSNYIALQRFKEYCPKVPIGYIMSVGFDSTPTLDVDFVSVEYKTLSANLVSAMHAADKKVHVWTVNSREQAINAIQLRVDNIITDNVEIVRKALYEVKRGTQ